LISFFSCTHGQSSIPKWKIDELEEYIKKSDEPVIINFWATYCVPCIKEIPELKILHNKYASKGFAIITISIDADKQNWIDAVKKYQLEKFRNVLANDEIHQKYSNTKQPIPSMLLINRQGIIIWNSMSPTVSLSEILSKEFNSQ